MVQVSHVFPLSAICCPFCWEELPWKQFQKTATAHTLVHCWLGDICYEVIWMLSFLHKIMKISEKKVQPQTPKEALLAVKGAGRMAVPKSCSLTPSLDQVLSAAVGARSVGQENSRPAPGQSSDRGSCLQRQAQARQCCWWYKPFSLEHGNAYWGKGFRLQWQSTLSSRCTGRLFPLSPLYHARRNEEQVYGKLSSVCCLFPPPSLFPRH